jgi:para-nitrobenzyl esterase
MNSTLADAEKSGLAFMAKMKASNIAELRQKSAQELIDTGGNFDVVADGYVIPADVFAAFRNGKFNDVAIMAGWVSGDGSLFGDQKLTPEKYKEQAIKNYGDKAEEYLKIFPGNTDEEIAASLKELNLMQFAALPAHLWAGFSKNQAFIYQFTHVPMDKPGFPNYGAFHTSEVPYALHTLHLWKRPWRDIDYAVEKTMNNYWVNKDSDPNGNSVPEWKKYDKSTGNIMEIGDQSQLKPSLHKSEFDFLERFAVSKK